MLNKELHANFRNSNAVNILQMKHTVHYIISRIFFIYDK